MTRWKPHQVPPKNGRTQLQEHLPVTVGGYFILFQTNLWASEVTGDWGGGSGISHHHQGNVEGWKTTSSSFHGWPPVLGCVFLLWPTQKRGWLREEEWSPAGLAPTLIHQAEQAFQPLHAPTPPGLCGGCYPHRCWWSQSHDQRGFQLIRMQEQNRPELNVFADWIWLSGLRREEPWRHPSTSSKLFYHEWDIYEPSHLHWGCCPVSMVTGVGLPPKAGIVLLVCPPFLLYRHHENLYLGYVAIFK